MRASLGPAGVEGAGVAGLRTCGSVWACPVCASKIALGRTDDLEAGIRSWVGMGGGFALLTLTMRHRQGQRLRDLWDGLSGAWRRFVSDGTYKRSVKAAGVEGYHRTTEVTYGDNGWHVHLHVLYFLGAGLGDQAAAHLGGVLTARWMDAVASQGFTALAAGQDWKVLHGSADALAGVAGYMVKGEYHERATAPRTARQVAMEVTRSDLKAARAGSRTPFAILGDLVAAVEADGLVLDGEAALWSEWERASKGRRQQVWSRGLRARLGLGVEASDEDLAAVEVEGVDLVVIDLREWKRFARDGRAHAALLAAVRTSDGTWLGARDAACRVLDEHGVTYRLVPYLRDSGGATWDAA